MDWEPRSRRFVRAEIMGYSGVERAWYAGVMRRPIPIRLALVTFAVSASAVAQTPAAPPPAPPAAAPAAPAPAAPAATPAAPPAAPAAAPAAPARVGPSPYSELIQKGDSSYVARDFDGAIATFRQEIEKNPNGALGHYRLGEAQLGKGDVAEAELSWQAALRFVGKDERLKSKILFVLADLKERQKAYDESVARWKDYDQHARSQPDSKGFPATAADRIKRADEWKKNVADSAAVKTRIEKRIKEADESMRKSSK
jgi:tetratricopeptide (TPR) repeat protein